MITDAQVKRAAEAIQKERGKVHTRDMVNGFDRSTWEQARAALEAIEQPEPLEDAVTVTRYTFGGGVLQTAESISGFRNESVARRMAEQAGNMPMKLTVTVEPLDVATHAVGREMEPS